MVPSPHVERGSAGIMSERTAPSEPEFHRAARIGDHAAIERLLAAGADIEERADLEFDHGPHLRGLTPLLTAARSIDGATVATLQLLLGRGADLRARAQGGGDAAWYAAGDGMRIRGLHPFRIVPEQVERLRFLLDAGLSPRGRAGNGSSCLCEACGAGDPERIALLLRRGAPPEADWGAADAEWLDDATTALLHSLRVGPSAFPSMDGLPSWVVPLFRAAESGSAECVRLLVDAGASVFVRDEAGSTALAHARSADVVRALVAAGADVRAVNEWTKDALAEVLDSSAEGAPLEPDRIEVARALLDAGTSPTRSPGRNASRLYDAAFTHNIAAIEFLLSIGQRPAADSYEDRTPLHAIAWQGQCDFEPKASACEPIIRALVAAGNPVDARDERGRSPLADACDGDGRNDTAIRVLLELGARPIDRRERGAV